MQKVVPLLVMIAAFSAAAEPRVERFAENPIIRPEMLPGHDGENINGPSLIRAPDWLPYPLGRYYLYFGDHRGQYIRLAYADSLAGPWKLYTRGTLRLDQTPDGVKHIASPDVIVDDAHKEIRMYFHCPSKTWPDQTSYFARSTDGINFTANGERLGDSYMRVFAYGGYWYGMTKPGRLCRAANGVTGFETGPNPFSDFQAEWTAAGMRMRHVAVDVQGDTLYVYFTRIGDVPERILRSSVALGPDWNAWKATLPETVLAPDMPYEGGDLEIGASKEGRSKGRERAVRDPAIFKEDGRTYLLYSVAGEAGIGIGELIEDSPAK